MKEKFLKTQDVRETPHLRAQFFLLKLPGTFQRTICIQRTNFFMGAAFKDDTVRLCSFLSIFTRRLVLHPLLLHKRHSLTAPVSFFFVWSHAVCSKALIFFSLTHCACSRDRCVRWFSSRETWCTQPRQHAFSRGDSPFLWILHAGLPTYVVGIRKLFLLCL